jgi:hypothetical protein
MYLLIPINNNVYHVNKPIPRLLVQVPNKFYFVFTSFPNLLGEHSPIASPLLPLIDSTGYLSVGELSSDDSTEENYSLNIPKNLSNDYFYHQQSDQNSLSSEAPPTLNDSTQNRLLARSGRTHFLTASLNDTSTIDEKQNENIFQSDTGLFNFPASNAQPIRIVPSDLTIVSEILSSSPPATLSRTKRIKNPSLTGDRLLFKSKIKKSISFSLVHHQHDQVVIEKN